MKQLVINKNDSNQRLDKFLTKHFKNMPMSLMYKYIRTKKIKLGGARTYPDAVLFEGDVLTFYISEDFFGSTHTDDAFKKIVPRLSVVYEDENIIIADKPSGMVCHADDGETYNTLINHIKAYLFKNGEYSPEKENSFAPALCNRIDRNTCGLVIAGKNAEAVRILNEKIKNREFDKRYLAVVHGKPVNNYGRITSFLEKDSSQNKVFVRRTKDSANVKSAVLEYKVLKYTDSLSLLEIKLITGRTHQIRAQMADAGHPLLGDGKYAKNKDDRKRGYDSQALCSYMLKFDFTGTETTLEYLNHSVFYASEPAFMNLFN